MSKRKVTDIVAYVNTVSPQKKKSFKMQVQLAEGVKKAICFDTTKINQLKTVKQSSEAIKFENAIIEEQSGNSNFADIIINKSTKIVTPQPSEVTFKKSDVIYQIIPIKAIDQSMDGELVSVEGMITLSEETKQIEKFGKTLTLSDKNYFTDKSATIRLTLWDEWIAYFKEQNELGIKTFKVRLRIMNAMSSFSLFRALF